MKALSVELAEALTAVASTPVGGNAWARAMDDLAEAWLTAGDLDWAIEIRREAIPLVSSDLAVELTSSLGIDIMTPLPAARRPAGPARLAGRVCHRRDSSRRN